MDAWVICRTSSKNAAQAQQMLLELAEHLVLSFLEADMDALFSE